ncbi:MAG: phosphate regulon transcriptional regulator PhoB [Rubrivivax sp.]|jgi:two-component system phosphate regulon response regulator PhoB|nr:phosphate regulon transcriptional regulator PhoB [Rubrivivax sp.]
MAHILVVEDESAIAELIALNLRHAGHEAVTAIDGESALEAVRERLPDLVVLDWMLPGTTGILLARQWRAEARTKTLPILMLTARADERDLVHGLDAGADDYLTKPFSTAELLARVRALLRRRSPQTSDQPVAVGELALDPATMRVTVAGSEVKLGPTEFRLLRFLLAHPERVHSRSHLLDRVWGDHVFIEERTVDVHIKRLREALGAAAAMVETVRGAGYRLTQSVSATNRA